MTSNSFPRGAIDASGAVRAFARRAVDAAGFHVLGIASAVVAAALWVTALTAGLVLAITVVAAPAILAVIAVVRAFTRLERRRALMVIPVPIPESPPVDRGQPAWARLKASLRDGGTWRDLAWTMLTSALSLVLGVAAIAAWAAAAYLVSLPAWYWSTPASSGVPSVGVAIDSLPRALLACLVGVLLVPIAALIGIVLARVDVAAMRAVLTPAQGAPDRAVSGSAPAGPAASGEPPLAGLTPRESEVLGLMAEGMSNAAIASELVITEGAVEKHVANIFGKLDLPPSSAEHRRVLAVRRYLDATPQ